MSETSYNQLPLTSFPFMKFKISNKLYSKWLYNIFYKVDLTDIPESSDSYEKLFDKNILPIKKLVKDISDLDNLTVKETNFFYLYDDSNFISNTFFTERNKQIQCYGFISLLYNNSDKHLISSKSRLKFNVLTNDQREFISLQLEDILTSKKL